MRRLGFSGAMLALLCLLAPMPACAATKSAAATPQKNGRRALAVRLRRKGKWAYPLAYLGLILVLAIGFLA
ncbi:MAG TPA: hypothetical protein VGM02_15925 [Acidobacteriaceae bacterium]|jgi:hypothetical protein